MDSLDKFFADLTPHSHKHWRQPVKVGRFTVTCSAATANKGLEAPHPDFGVYLAEMWAQDMADAGLVTNGCRVGRIAKLNAYPAMFVRWPDMGIVKTGTMNVLVETILSKLRHGKWVDFGCAFGHGRTGTLLACLIARIEHITAGEAIEAVHIRYCRDAVESRSQGLLVAEYVHEYLKRKKRRTRWA